MAEVNGMLSALSWPQRQLKETISGDEEEWFSPEGMDPRLYAAGNVALDLVADPLNLIPVGAFAKAGKGAKNVIGGALTSADNYIKDWYGITDSKDILPSAAESKLVKILTDRKGLTDLEALALVRKGKGAVDWALRSSTEAIKQITSPAARALYNEQGVSTGSQRWVRDKLQEADKVKGQEKAAAQVNFNQHVARQAGREGAWNPAMREVGERSNLVDYQPYSKENVSKAITDNPGEVKFLGETFPNEVSKADGDFIADHVQKAWGDSEHLVVKRGQSGTGGPHFNDVLRDNPANPTISKVFLKYDGEPTLKQLYRGLTEAEGKQKGRNKWKVKNPSLEHAEEHGLWLTGSKTGRAVTEGGINWLMKVDPSGRLMGVMSDKHDFLEKLPGVGKVVTEALPQDLVAITPPMFTTIQAQKKNQFAKAGLPQAPASVTMVPRTPSPIMGDYTIPELLESYVNAAPSRAGTNRERWRNVGMLSAPLAVGVTPQSDE